MNESYISSPTNGTVEVKKIPEGQYFLMGDNRSQSMDSRNAEVGLISQEKIIGKVLIRILPIHKFGVVK